MATDWTLDRRRLFSGSAAALLAGMAALRQSAAASVAPQARLVSAARIEGTDGAALVSASGIGGFTLPGRAHALTLLRDGEVALIGRRPGKFAAIVDPASPERPARLFAPIAGHRFAGHAAIAPDGKTLVTSEIDAETGNGSVVEREAATGAPRRTSPVGIEPHDLLFADGGARLVVAVGGIAFAAEVKGPAINAGRIDSAIVELDPRSGTILKRHALPAEMRSLSLRHMAVAPDGKTIAFGMQDQDRSQTRALMGLLRLGEPIGLLEMPTGPEEGALRFYVGSVAIDAGSRYVAATSPKGGSIGLWSLSDGRWLGGFKLLDVCGLAADSAAGGFWATSGHGDLVKLSASESGLAADALWQAPLAFDNHLLRI